MSNLNGKLFNFRCEKIITFVWGVGWGVVGGIITFSLQLRCGWMNIKLHVLQGWAGKAFWLPGTGREIENHIPVLREGNGNSQIATGREGKGNLRLVIPGIPGNPGNHIKSKIKFKIIFMPWQAIRSQSFFNQCKDDICNRFTQL